MSSAAVMVTSYCSGAGDFSDLLCTEDSGTLCASSPDCSPEVSPDFLPETSPEISSEMNLFEVDDESISELIEVESEFLKRICTSSLVIPIDFASRFESVNWILKVHDRHGFQPLTAFLAVSYIDRFICSRRLPITQGWPLQLLCVACLWLAAKMEEARVPNLRNLQHGSSELVFESKTVERMEVHVLGVLEWRLMSITPLDFIAFFTKKVDSSGICSALLSARARDIILSYIREVGFMEHRPSCVAAGAVLCAAEELADVPHMDWKEVESWCPGLNKEGVKACREIMHRILMEEKRKKGPKVLPQLRVTTAWGEVEMGEEDGEMATLFNYSSKKRRLQNICSKLFTDRFKKKEFSTKTMDSIAKVKKSPPAFSYGL